MKNGLTDMYGMLMLFKLDFFWLNVLAILFENFQITRSVKVQRLKQTKNNRHWKIIELAVLH